MIRKIIITGLIGLTGLFLFFIVKSAQLLSAPLPNPTPLQVWLPKGAEIRPRQDVHPGTFYVRLPVAEFRHRFPTGGIVSFPSKSTDDQTVEVWKSQGDGLFWKTTQTIQPWKQALVSMRVVLDDEELIAYPERDVVFGTFLIAISVLFATVFIIATAVVFLGLTPLN